jgi:hypothetical protein
MFEVNLSTLNKIRGYRGGNTTDNEEASRFQLLFPNSEVVGVRKGIPSPTKNLLQHSYG